MGSVDKTTKCTNFLLSAVLLTLVPSLAAAQIGSRSKEVI
jgi:hypothetical protein